jgi:hypothetical protein
VLAPPERCRDARLAIVAGQATYRVVIADDEYLVREGARSVLSAVPGIAWWAWPVIPRS